MMRRRQPETLLNKSLAAFVQVVVKLSRCLEAIGDIQNIVGSLPYTLADEFTSMVIPSLNYTSIELLQSCVHPGLRTLDMSSWHAEVQEQMCAVLPRLELRHLSLSRKVTSLSFSTKLLSFSYPDYCSDSIIQELATTCKSLQILDISRAKYVTDNCVSFLLQLQELHDLNVSEVELTEEASTRLIFGLHKLRKWQGGYELLDIYDERSESMKDYTCVIMDMTYGLNYFPNLTHVSVIDTCVPEALEAFGTLEHLQHFNVVFPFQYDLGMREFVSTHGKKLLTFSVEEVLEMDFLHLVTMCPQLKTLQLEKCYISIDSMGAKGSLPHFQSVEKLEVIVSSEDWFPYFEFPFFDYMNLQHLVAINVRQIDDISLYRAILERNWLRELRTLELRGKLGHLSIRSFKQLLEHCPHLESVSDLAAWPGVPQEDLDSITNDSKQKNLDIKIRAYPSPTI